MDKYGIEKEKIVLENNDIGYAQVNRAPYYEYVEYVLWMFERASFEIDINPTYKPFEDISPDPSLTLTDDSYDPDEIRYFKQRFKYLINHHLEGKINQKIVQRYQMVKDELVGIPHSRYYNMPEKKNMSKRSWEEFISYIKTRGSEFYNLEKQIALDLSKKYHSADFKDFLAGYFIMGKGCADINVVDHVYNILDERVCAVWHRDRSYDSNFGKRLDNRLVQRYKLKHLHEPAVGLTVNQFFKYCACVPALRAFAPEIVADSSGTGGRMFACLFGVRSDELEDLLYKVIHEITLGQIE